MMATMLIVRDSMSFSFPETGTCTSTRSPWTTMRGYSTSNTVTTSTGGPDSWYQGFILRSTPCPINLVPVYFIKNTIWSVFWVFVCTPW